MKRKISMLSVLLAGAMCLSGCFGGGNEAETTTDGASVTPANNGHYENDGFIGDSSGGDETGGNTSEGELENGNSDDNAGGNGESGGGNGNEGHANGENAAGNDNGAGANAANDNGAGANAANGGSAPAANTTVEKEGMAAAALRITKVCWGMGRELDSDNRPVAALQANGQYGDLAGIFIDETDEKVIYLTFDEGYENGYTSQILDVLKKAEAKAVFFVTYDYCRSSPDLVQRMIDEGHIVGNHSYTHPSLPDCSAREAEEEVMLLHDYVLENFDYEMKLFRFPKGEFSEKTLSIVKELGYTSVFWSFAYEDWDVNKQPAADEAFDVITKATHKGAVYLLHAVSKANADCLGDVIDYWKNNGYSVGNFYDIV